MRRLYHMWLSAYSRKVRIALAEKGLEFDLEFEKIWERRQAFLALNPAGEVPVLVEEDGRILADSTAICEYLDEAYPDRPFIGFSPEARAECRRLVAWFDLKFGNEVTRHFLNEKIMKQFLRRGEPNAAAIRAASQNIHYHLDYIGYLSDRRRWLAGDDFSLADITAAAHLSCVDYLGNVPWEDHGAAKDWYARVKSRPSVRPLLADRIGGLAPAEWYDDLDF